MNRNLRQVSLKWTIASALCALLLCVAQVAAADPRLRLPDFDALAGKASKTVTVTLDSKLLGMAARFLDAKDPADAAAREVIAGLEGIYVRSYTFDEDFAYPLAEINAVRRQLSAPGWQRLVEVRSRKEQTAVDIYVSQVGEKTDGLAIIASEPRQFTIVNIVGAIDLDKLHALEGNFGIPEVELESGRKPAK